MPRPWGCSERPLGRGLRLKVRIVLLVQDSPELGVHLVFCTSCFFAMRRSDELFVNKAHTHGILMRHVVLMPSSHLSLWVQGQKTDQLGQGHAVTLAWVTGSGIQLGW